MRDDDSGPDLREYLSATTFQAEAEPRTPTPQTIGPYRILRRIGEGGMGEVFEAEQEQPVRRRVALKLIKSGMDSDEVIARFESERQALALMNHPGIARIIDGGTTEQGRPYFAMEFVDGVPITRYCNEERLGVHERLDLFLRVCDGVQHAHQKGIIHRDLKPSNVLVTVQDAGPVPKIIDFGIAKATAQPLTERTMYTGLGRLVGTPEYMSPEQAAMGALDIDTRSDVYSLAVLLYELLTGAQPFDSRELREAGLEGLRRKILEEEPPRPSSRLSTLGEGARSRQLRGDLDWITMKGLEKDRARRYGSAAELAADVRRYLEHDPVLASPPSKLYRLQKFVRRHRAGASFAAVLAVILLGSAVGLAIQARRIVLERDRANQEAEQARLEREGADRVSGFLVDLFKLSDPDAARDGSITAREILDRGAAKIDRELAGRPHVQSRLMHAIAGVYSNLGMNDDARELAERALMLLPDDPDDPLPIVAANRTVLGHVLVGDGDYAGARRHYERALAIREAVLAPDHPDIATSLNSLGNLLWVLGDYEGARRLHERAFEIRESLLASDNSDLTVTLFNVATLRRYTGDRSGAWPLFERALALQRAELGEDHPHVGATLSAMAELSALRGEHDAARRLHEQALEIREQAYGPSHFQVAWSLSGYALSRLRAGDRADAERLHRRALDVFRETESLHNPMVIYYEASYAALVGSRDEAIALLRRAVLELGYSGPVTHDPNLDSLRGDPEFEGLVASMRANVAGIAAANP